MAHEMDLFHSTVEKTPEEARKILEPFALHALAAIGIHEKPEAKERGLTFPKICAADPVLTKDENISARYLLCAFGRNATPVLIRLLTKECGLTQEDLDRKVPEVVAQLLQNLHW